MKDNDGVYLVSGKEEKKMAETKYGKYIFTEPHAEWTSMSRLSLDTSTPTYSLAVSPILNSFLSCLARPRGAIRAYALHIAHTTVRALQKAGRDDHA
jgi:hypothetical protein